MPGLNKSVRQHATPHFACIQKQKHDYEECEQPVKPCRYRGVSKGNKEQSNFCGRCIWISCVTQRHQHQGIIEFRGSAERFLDHEQNTLLHELVLSGGLW